MSEHALIVLFMPVYFVLGQNDVESPSRHDKEVLTDLFRGEGSTKINLVVLGNPKF